jgi:hypothetical protein
MTMTRGGSLAEWGMYGEITRLAVEFVAAIERYPRRSTEQAQNVDGPGSARWRASLSQR